jgi:hypothetical protein
MNRLTKFILELEKENHNNKYPNKILSVEELRIQNHIIPKLIFTEYPFKIKLGYQLTFSDKYDVFSIFEQILFDSFETEIQNNSVLENTYNLNSYINEVNIVFFNYIISARELCTLGKLEKIDLKKKLLKHLKISNLIYVVK